MREVREYDFSARVQEWVNGWGPDAKYACRLGGLLGFVLGLVVGSALGMVGTWMVCHRVTGEVLR